MYDEAGRARSRRAGPLPAASSRKQNGFARPVARGMLVDVVLARIFPSCRRLSARADELEREAAELRGQVGALDNERNTLTLQVKRLEKDIRELRQSEARAKEDARQLAAMRYERDEWKGLYEKLEAERGAIEKELREIRAEVEMNRERLWAPPGHPYSPVTDPHDPFVRLANSNHLESFHAPTGLHLDEDAMLRLLGWLGEHAARFPFGAMPTPGFRYHTGNGHYGAADGALLYSMLLEYKPARYIEIGCGHASLLAMDTNDRELAGHVEMTFFDPRPDVILSLLKPDDPYRSRVHARRSHDVPERVFAELRRGDMLSIESSHVAKTGSDVCDIFFRVLPNLAPGVLVHLHDIFYPFEYPHSWVVEDNRSWNEAYLLRAFLQYNASFRVLLFNDLMVRRHGEALAGTMPGIDATNASGIWLEKIA